jgi:hypothetical protein
MAREKVIKVRCDRCKRTELVPAVADKVGADFDASFKGQRLVYEDLCLRCAETIEHIWLDLKEWDREVKYTMIRNGPLVPENTAAPMAPATNFSPPQPHSAAAGKR